MKNETAGKSVAKIKPRAPRRHLFIDANPREKKRVKKKKVETQNGDQTNFILSRK